MTQAHVLNLPDFHAPFILEVGASAFGLGAVLVQTGKLTSFLGEVIGHKAAS
jgi:hypothetical protein